MTHNFLCEISQIFCFDKARPCVGAFLYKNFNNHDSGKVLDIDFFILKLLIFLQTLLAIVKNVSKKFIVKPEKKFPKPYIVQWLHRFPHYQQDAVLIPSLAAAH